MKKAILIFATGLLTAVAAYAQGTPQTQSGDKALLFSINGFGDFGVTGTVVGMTPLRTGGIIDTLLDMTGQSFLRPVAGVAMKFFLADNVALRAGIGFNMESNNDPVYRGDSLLREDPSSRSAFAVSPGIEIHLVQEGPVTLYTGAVLSFASATNSTGADSLENSSTQTGIGFGAVLGAEFFPWSNLSLGAEYQIGLMLHSTSSAARGESLDGRSTTHIGITGPIRITLGLHI